MSKIDDLIKELCPGGVKYERIKDVYLRLKGTPITAGKMKEIANPDGDIRVFAGGRTVIDAFELDIPNANITNVPAVLVQSRGVIDVVYYDKPFTFKNEMWAYTHNNQDSIKYLYYVLKNHKEYLRDAASSMGSLPQISLKVTEELKIPIPPLEIQKEIVRVLDSFTELEAELEAELEVRKKQYEYYRNTLLTFEDDKNITWVELGEVAKYEQPSKYIVRSSDYNDNFSIPVLTAGKTFILGYTDESSGIYNASVHPVIIFDDFTTANKWVDFDFKVKSSAMKIITSLDEGTALLKYIYHWLNTLPSGLVEGDHKRQWISSWSKKKIPIPPLEKQKQIVSILDKFEKLTNDISVGLPAEIEARRKQYEYYRNKLLTFKELECAR